MSFVGMGWQEILVIAVVAIMIFGPDKLPELAGQAGKLLRDFRRMTTDMTGEFEKQTGVSVKDIKSSVDKELAGLKSEVAGTTASVSKEINSVKSSVNKTATSVSKSVSAATGSKSSSTAKPAAKSATTAKGSTTAAKTASAKPAATKTTTSSSAKKEAPAIDPRPSKNDPLAGVSMMDDVPPAETNGNGDAGKPSPAVVGAPASGGETLADALMRSRARRQSAGYSQGPPSLN